MTSYGYIVVIIVDSCMIWFHFDCIMQLKKSYHIATNVCSRKSATFWWSPWLLTAIFLERIRCVRCRSNRVIEPCQNKRQIIGIGCRIYKANQSLLDPYQIAVISQWPYTWTFVANKYKPSLDHMMKYLQCFQKKICTYFVLRNIFGWLLVNSTQILHYISKTLGKSYMRFHENH